MVSSKSFFPICLLLTGAGVRQTLSAIQKTYSTRDHRVPTEPPCLTGRFPKRWNIRDAYIKGPDGARIVDFRRSNLHVMSYSVPVDATMMY